MTIVGRAVCCILVVFSATAAGAQVQTGSIVGAVLDDSGGVLPGVVVTLRGDRLIGGAQTVSTDSSGTYRFDRLPPGDYVVRFELQGFRTVERTGIRVHAAFTASVNTKLEVGALEEAVTVLATRRRWTPSPTCSRPS